MRQIFGKTTSLALFLSLPLLIHCGGDKTRSDTSNTSYAAPTPAPTPVPAAVYLLEKYAKISSNQAPLNDNYAVANIADGSKGNATGSSPGLVWIPAGPANSAYAKLEWNSQVNISEISLFDNPLKGSQITKGEIRFENSKIPEKNFSPVLFTSLPDDASGSVKIAGPSSPVTAVTILILNHSGDQAGLGEVSIYGNRVEEKIDEMNIAPYGKVTGFSSVADTALYAGSDTGPNRTAKVKDEDISASASPWTTDGNGSAAYLEMTFDRAYEIKKVELFDLAQSGTNPHFKTANVRFEDADVVKQVNKNASDISGAVEISSSVITKKVRIELTDIVPGSSGSYDTGLLEVKITGAYTP